MLKHSINTLIDEKVRLERMMDDFPQLKDNKETLQTIADIEASIAILRVKNHELLTKPGEKYKC